MPRIELGSPQEKELTSLVFTKLADFGWPDNDVLANFIVVMVANEKTRDEITSELSDIVPEHTVEFVDWLFEQIGGSNHQETPQAEVTQSSESQPEPMDESQSRPSAGPASRGSSRLLMTAISGATRTEPAQARPAPSRVYENERQASRSREASTSPVRNREGLTTKGKDERIRFRRTSEERSRDDERIDSRLGNGGNNGGKDRLRGRLGRIEDRLGWKNESSGRLSDRDRSRDRDDYHGNRGGKSNTSGSSRNGNSSPRGNDRASRLRDIESRLGGPVLQQDDNNIPRHPAGWSASAERELATAPPSNQSRCRFWPNCSQGENCQFWHPKELCQAFPNCPNPASSCMYVHPQAELTAEQAAAAARQALMQSMRPNGSGFGGAPFAPGAQQQECKFGARCTRPDCKFRHSERDANKQKCRFFPNCTKPDCPFFHPPYGESLATDTAMEGAAVESRLPTPCRFGDMCTRPGCHFTHPRDSASAESSGIPLCKFSPCTRPDCHFRHLPGAAAGGHNKTLILNGSAPTPGGRSERFAGGVVDESNVEKLHVPASTHWASGGVSHGTNQTTTQDVAAEEALLQADMDMEMEL